MRWSSEGGGELSDGQDACPTEVGEEGEGVGDGQDGRPAEGWEGFFLAGLRGLAGRRVL